MARKTAHPHKFHNPRNPVKGHAGKGSLAGSIAADMTGHKKVSSASHAIKGKGVKKSTTGTGY